jgi:hypothetical protein
MLIFQHHCVNWRVREPEIWSSIDLAIDDFFGLSKENRQSAMARSKFRAGVRGSV